MGLTLACNFIDLKDREGDLADGIKTLPVLWGMRPSQLLIGVFFALCYIWVGVLCKDSRVLLFSAAAGVVQFILINRKNYDERPVFIVYLSSLGVVLWYLAH